MHQVRVGESVWSISHKYGISMNDFIKWNKIKNNLIHPGQQVIVKQPASTSKPASKPATKPNTPATYKVKAGDSVWLIANRYGVSMDDLVKWNKIKNYTIHSGQVLTIQTIVSTQTKSAITTTPKVEPKPGVTTTPKTEKKSGIIANPKVKNNEKILKKLNYILK